MTVGDPQLRGSFFAPRLGKGPAPRKGPCKKRAGRQSQPITAGRQRLAPPRFEPANNRGRQRLAPPRFGMSEPQAIEASHSQAFRAENAHKASRLPRLSPALRKNQTTAGHQLLAVGWQRLSPAPPPLRLPV